jgi:hypothetical protein
MIRAQYCLIIASSTIRRANPSLVNDNLLDLNNWKSIYWLFWSTAMCHQQPKLYLMLTT